jgi:hypothetical protein
LKTDKMHDTKMQIEQPTEQIGQLKSPMEIWNQWLKSGLRPYTTFTQAWEAQQKWENLQLTKNEQ